MYFRVKTKPFVEVIVFYFLLITIRFIGYFFNCDLLILLVYIAYIWFFIKRSTYTLGIKYLWYIVMISAHVLSVFYVENTATFFENLLTTSYHTGALWPLVFGYITFFEVIKQSEVHRKKLAKKEGTGNEKETILIIQGLVIVGVLFLSFLLFRSRNHFYLISGVRSRYDYKLLFFDRIDYMYTYSFYLIPLAVMLLKKKPRNIWAITFLGLEIVYLFWIGTQFGSYFTIGYITLVSIFSLLDNINHPRKKISRKNTESKSKKRIALMGIGLLIGIFIFVILYRITVYGNTINSAMNYIIRRATGGNSDVWWSVYDHFKDSGWKIEEFTEEIIGCIHPQSNVAERNYGIYKMMRIVAPKNVLNDYFSRNVVFTQSTQATLFYYFKYTGLILGEIILGILLYTIVNGLIEAVKKYDVLETLLFARFLILFPEVSGMSSLSDLLSTTNLMCIIILIIWRVYKKNKAYYIGYRVS